MQLYDVLIVGGGPAGSTMAYSLKNAGLSIAILDKQSFPRQKICAGWVTPEVMRMLNIDLQDYAKDRILQGISGFKISQLGQTQVQSHYAGEPVSYGIRRIEFDDYLLQRCGAELILGEAFDSCEQVEDGWIVNGHYKTKLLVGAGGHFCPVARATGLKSGTEVAVAAQEAEFEMNSEQKANCTINEEVPELFFTPDLKGYGWVFRKGDYLNVGLGREDKSRLPKHVKEFCDYLVSTGKIPANIEAKYNGHAYLLYPHAKREMIAEKALLIGDAVGLAYAQSGEGIRPAIESAMLAADLVRELDSDYSLSRLEAYRDAVEQRFGPRLPEPKLMERLPILIKRFFASQLMKTHWFTKNIVTDKWFLQSHQKPLPAIKP
ncbi:MAG: NAD(P)/FAD-dependent oxidoreductase [Pseudomonadales bacterium]